MKTQKIEFLVRCNPETRWELVFPTKPEAKEFISRFNPAHYTIVKRITVVEELHEIAEGVWL